MCGNRSHRECYDSVGADSAGVSRLSFGELEFVLGDVGGEFAKLRFAMASCMYTLNASSSSTSRCVNDMPY